MISWPHILRVVAAGSVPGCSMSLARWIIAAPEGLNVLRGPTRRSPNSFLAFSCQQLFMILAHGPLTCDM